MSSEQPGGARLQPEPFVLELPAVEPGRMDQDEEWCLVHHQGKTERIRFHDYARIYGIPGLYEELFYHRLRCASPRTVAGLLSGALGAASVEARGLTALDVGAGSGMVGEALKEIGVERLVGVDLIPEAAAACERDRPGLYAEFVVADLTGLGDEEQQRIRKHRPNLLSTVAALGFGDIPPQAFAAAWNLVETPAWVAFNIKEAFLSAQYQFGFSLLVRRLIEEGLFVVAAQRPYTHRLSLAGEPLRYVALVGRKTGPVPAEWEL